MKRKAATRIFIMGAGVGILLCLIMIFLLQILGVIPKWWNTSLADDIYKRVGVVEAYIDKYYWKDDISDQKMSEYAAKGMVSALEDKYSMYYTKQEYEDSMTSVNGDYNGIGATVQMINETKEKVIIELQKGAPAEKAGLKVGDVIVMINGEDVSEKSLDDTVAMIKGEDGKKSVLAIVRKEKEKEVKKEITVVAEKIIIQSVSSKMLEGSIGYIHISSFDKETVKQFSTAIANLDKQGQKGMILDVRDNGGGSLEAVIAMLDELLPKGKLITEKSKLKGDTVYESTDKKHFDKPIVVLINGNSASASEVFAGTLQDRKVASLVGVKSYGKGVVQTIFSLQNSVGGGLKLTTGEYFLPSGRSIHEEGLTPDVTEEYTGTSKELGAEDDNQLARAVEIVKVKMQ